MKKGIYIDDRFFFYNTLLLNLPYLHFPKHNQWLRVIIKLLCLSADFPV